MTKILVYDRAVDGGFGLLGLRYETVGYGYYARRFGFSYEYVRPGAIISGSGPCPSVIWIEEFNFFENRPFLENNFDGEQALHELGLGKIGVAELKRYADRGTLIVVR
jgi:hypothetical protein